MRFLQSALLVGIACGMLTGCQSTTQVKSTVIDTYKILQHGDIRAGSNTLRLSCEASQGCEVERIDDIIIIDEQTRRPTSQAIERGMLRMEGSVFSVRHQYAISMPAGVHELKVRFYPTSGERSEKFHVIHQFLAGHNYKLVMYRKKSASTGGSLLNVAMPNALCVDLLQDDLALRRFCRPHDVVTGLGEFVEQRV